MRDGAVRGKGRERKDENGVSGFPVSREAVRGKRKERKLLFSLAEAIMKERAQGYTADPRRF